MFSVHSSNMSSIASNKEAISITSGRKTVVVLISKSELFCIDHDSITKAGSSDPDKKTRITSDGDGELGIGLLSSDFAPQENLLAFSTLSKTLCIVAVDQLGVSLKKVCQLVRGASKVKFTPSGQNVVVADKSGDVYLFDVLDENVNGTFVLGHLSLLLDLIITQDEKYIITCDRDEKIRVSSFPNGYNIVSYCLGHREFVSSIHLVPHNDMFLISTSGDSTVRCWDFMVGNELMVFDTLSYLEQRNLFPNGQKDIELSAITDSAVFPFDNISSIICLVINKLNVCLVLKCTSSCQTQKIECCVNQHISLNDWSPWRLSFNSNYLWLILNSVGKVKIKVLKFDSDSCKFSDEISTDMEHMLNNINSKDLNSDVRQDIVQLLYKRKFDNIQEYLVKKEARLMTSTLPVKRPKC